MERSQSRTQADQPGAGVDVGTTSTLAASENYYCQERIFVNDSDTKMYLRLAASGAVLGEGVALYPNGGSWSTDKYGGPVSAIHGGTGTKRLCVVEV